ncbi:pentapeptide repeat-containing protein [Listeria monocytogenes]|uniref:pentapeptide repeat-containing protein n=1 Tax=Listeria monocytogenes TaxID=1639 RepID=UPI0008F5F227|nr:pentapeptide repeat-containing protein [Listeria monocytogenes]EAD1954457.1 pentapeptide repeat-containing protein [Listeria monocytogenes]EEO0585524.1 pentapeptide repeat-containing protein [Listeria monocytogenes]EEO1190285.1 pentapeptide repeat-containing protein [Listeria monocytogenes]EEO1892978.1 pentapeptide repeat-containing protein [Listeria monocytogenes]EEO1959787.1 pentapeptide repeat-containing protein [Listeria monocytogenes]
MKQEELDIILENHEKWLRDEGGERADLSYADLSNADLRHADLSNADLREADLREVNLSYADLREADLRHADLREVNLSYANLNWVNWQDVRGLTVVAVQVDTTRKNNQITYIKELDIWTTGCFQGTLEELRNAVNEIHADNQRLKARYERAIDFILREE